MDRVPIAPLALLTLVPSAVSFLAAAPALGAVTLEAPATVTAGEVVELRWHGLPAQVDEVELLLSLDDGRTFHVRVTPELDGHAETFRWRVPDLPTPAAVLMLRMGDGAGERIAAISRPFRILHAEGAPRADLGFHEGLMWTGLAPEGGCPGGTLAPGTPRLEGLAPDPRHSLPGPELRLARPGLGRAPVAGAAPVTSRPCPPPPATPRHVPLRN